MKFFSLLAMLVLLTACGPSEKEITNTAIITCNIMAESRKMDAAMRIREINAAREKIGADPYLETDYEIIESIRLGLCQDLVRNDPDVFVNMSNLLREESEKRIAALQEERRQREEAVILRIEKEQEIKRQKEERKAEEDRIRKIKAEEKKRLEEEQESAYRKIIQEHLKAIKNKPAVTSIFRDALQNTMNITLACDFSLNGIDFVLELTFLGDKQLRVSDSFQYCRGSATLIASPVNDLFLYKSKSRIEDLTSAKLEIKRLDSRHMPKEFLPSDVSTIEALTYGLTSTGLPYGKRVVIDLPITPEKIN